MSEDATNVAPAGGAASNADSGPKVFSSLHAAAEAIGALEPDEPKNKPIKPDTEPDENSAEEADEEADAETPDDEDSEDGGDDAPVEEDDESDDEESEPQVDGESVDFESLKGDTKIRLRDGTEFTVADVKRRLDDLRGVDDRSRYLNETYGQVQNWAQGLLQRRGEVENILPVAIQAVANTLPDPPQFPMLTQEGTDEYDPISNAERISNYHAAVHQYETGLNQLRGLRAAYNQIQQQTAASDQENVKQYISYQRQQLMTHVPELRDPKAREKFQDELFDVAVNGYGFTEDEIQESYDWRLIPLMRDAIAYKKLQKGKPQPTNKKIGKTPSDTPQVMSPQKRVGQTQKTTARDKKITAIRKKGGGSLREIGGLLADFD